MIERVEKFKLPAGLTPLKGEKVVFYGRMALIANLFWLVLGVIFTFTPILETWVGKVSFKDVAWIYILGLIFLSIPFLRVISSEYMVSNKRAYVKYGLISRRIAEARLEWITDIHIRQGIFGRFFNYGDVLLATPSGPITSLVMYGVHDPLHVRTVVLEWVKKAQEAQRIKRKLEKLVEEYEFGRISETKYKELKEKYEKELSALESD